MATILCATRGGEASIPAQERAIALAKEQGVDLVFLYVADVQFLHLATSAIVVDVATEIEHMGEFLLLMAKERAAKAGIKAEALVKRGIFRQALMDAAQEIDANLIVLGSPHDNNLTMRSFLEEVAAEIKTQIGVDTIIVERT